MSKPVEIEFLMKDRLTPGLDKAGKDIDGLAGKASSAGAELEAARRQAQDLRNVIALLESQMEELRLAGQNASPDLDQSRNIAKIEALQNQIRELEVQLKQLENISENTQVVPPDMPQAKQQFNGLHMSIQQIAREMPSLAMGPQMFFLAISNNLPIFADEVSRAKKEYAELVKTGQKGTPVWKQILSSLFSWQTAMTTGIMLLVMYGKEITEWTKDLFSAKKGVEEFKLSLKEIAEIEKDGRAEMVRVRFEIDSVIASLKNFTGSKEQEKAKVEELNRKYGEAFGYYDSIAQWYDILTQKSADYIQMLFLQAKAQAMVSKAVEADEEVNKIKSQSPEDAESAMGFFGKMGQYMIQSSMAETGQFYDAQAAIDEHNRKAYDDLLQNAQNKRDGFLKEAEQLTREAAELGKTTGIGGYVRPDKPRTTPEQEAAKRLKAEQRLSEETLSLQRKNQQDEINLQKDGTRKKLEQINFDYEERKAEIKRDAEQLAKLNKESGKGSGLTGAQQEDIDNASSLNLQKRQQAVAEVYKAEFDAMRDHLKEYGTFQQQKLAIAEEYAEKIRNAAGEGERLSLGVERDSRLAGIEAQELKAKIDWGTVFGEFGGMFSDMIKPVLEDAKKYMRTDEFQNADHASQEALVAAVRQMEQSLGGADRVSFKKLGAEVTAYQNALSDLKDAQAEYADIYAALISAQQEYIQAQKSGTEEEKEAARQSLETAQANADAASENINTLQETANNAQQSLSSTANGLKTSMDNVRDGLQQIASGSISSAYNGLITLGKGAKELDGKLGEAFGKVSDTLEDVPIVGWIVSIIDLFKDGLSVVVGGLLDAVFNAVSGILDDVLSGDLFVTIGESLLQGVGKIFDALTFGGFSSWFGSGESDKTLHEDIEYLTASHEDLKRSIDNLADKMDETAVSDASEVYERQKQLLQEQMDNTQEMMRRSGKAYSNGFLGIGGTKSSNHRVNEAMSGSDWDRISNVVGRHIGSASDFWGLSSEEMAKVADEATDLYSKIKSHADDGHENAAQYMDEYIDYYKQLEELQEAYYEKLTGVSFDSVRGNFKSMLLDMKSDADAFAEDLDETLLEAVVEGLMSEEYSNRLRKWYKNFADSMKDGSMSSAEVDDLRSEYEKIVSDAIADRNALMETLGIDPTENGTSQSAKAGGFNAMTQDQGTKLEGMFTSGLQHWSSIDDKMENVIDKMNAAEGHLARIEENTGSSAAHLAEIKDEIKKMIRDGLKVK